MDYNKGMKKYTLLEHTADIGIHVFGETLKDLFENAAAGIFSLLTDTRKVSEKTQMLLSVDGHDREDLMVRWLSELLFLCDTRLLLFKTFEITLLEDRHLEATVRGEPIDLSRHTMKMDIKAVTYYGLEVRKNCKGIWETKILFDV